MRTFSRTVVAAFGLTHKPSAPKISPNMGETLGGVPDLDHEFDEELEYYARRAAQEQLDAAVRKVHSLGGAVAQSHLMEGRAPQEIVSLAEDSGIGLIVMGSRGRGGVSRTLMGSVSDSVMRHAHCPVLVVRAYQEGHA